MLINGITISKFRGVKYGTQTNTCLQQCRRWRLDNRDSSWTIKDHTISVDEDVNQFYPQGAIVAVTLNVPAAGKTYGGYLLQQRSKMVA